MNGRPTAADAGKIDVAGDLTVNRLGSARCGSPAPGIWGDPPDLTGPRKRCGGPSSSTSPLSTPPILTDPRSVSA
jgi:hypothetical protein